MVRDMSCEGINLIAKNLFVSNNNIAVFLVSLDPLLHYSAKCIRIENKFSLYFKDENYFNYWKNQFFSSCVNVLFYKRLQMLLVQLK